MRRRDGTDNRHAIVTPGSHIRALGAANVTAEGGGTASPTLGGGIGFSREHLPPATSAAGEVRR